MSLVQLNWNPNKRELRSFGAIFLVGFVIIGLVKMFWPFDVLMSRSETAGYWIIGIGLFVGAVGLTGTRLAMPFYLIWIGIAFVMGNIISRLIVAAMYFLVLTPMRVLSNLAGRDRLQLKKRDTDTYWCDIALPREIEKYERQF